VNTITASFDTVLGQMTEMSQRKRKSPSLEGTALLLTVAWSFDSEYPKFDVFDAGGPQCHFITSVPRAKRFPYVRWHIGAKLLPVFWYLPLFHTVFFRS